MRPAMAMTAFLFTGLSACSGSLFRSHAPAPTTYLLSVKTQPKSDAVGIPADLTVLLPRVRTGLETDRIAVLYPDRRLDYFAAARWSGPLDEVMQDLTLQAFRDRFRNVHTDTSAFAAGYWLEMDVVDFQAEYAAGGAPTAHVHLVVRVGNADDRRVLGEFEADVRQPAADNRLTAVVAAYDAAADQAFSAIVGNVTDALARGAKTVPARPLP
jgi:ABC-type uncharacterized transport system auxiliary subunit